VTDLVNGLDGDHGICVIKGNMVMVDVVGGWFSLILDSLTVFQIC
jgi:hypothetical protein